MESWKKQLIVYQIYPRSFYDSNADGIGDIQGIIKQVPYLSELGINALWLSPVYQSPMDDNGYDVSDYCDVHPDFGTLDDLKMLIKVLHEHHIKLLMDLVVNHTSDEHPWFIESKNKDSDKHDYYIWRQGKSSKKAPNNWSSFFTGKAWTYDPSLNEYYLHLFGSKQPDLNWENPAVLKEVTNIVEFWTNLGVDGFRLDVINLISKPTHFPKGRFRIALVGREHYMNGPRVHEHLHQLNQSIFKPANVVTVGETVFVTPEEAMDYVDASREELDMVFHFEHMSVDNWYKWFILPFKPKKLKKILNRWQHHFKEKGWNALYLENHDQPRSVSRFGNDQDYWKESAKMLATMMFFQRGTPYIYQGQEIGMTNADFTDLKQYKDIETQRVYDLGRKTLKLSHRRMMGKIRYMSRDNARTPMQWNDRLHAGFTEGTPWIDVNHNKQAINVESQIKDTTSILHYYKQLIALRKEHETLVEGLYTPYYENHKSLVVYTREYHHDCFLIVANFSEKTTTFKMPKRLGDYKFEVILSNYPQSSTMSKTLKPYEAIVYHKHKEGTTL